jgi:hypothetical protein
VVKRTTWLSVTPEPERELPKAVATLRAGREPTPSQVAAEAQRIERLLLRSGERRWLAYLHEVVGLTEAGTASAQPAVSAAAARARAVLANHHNLLLGLPGAGARLTATDRARLVSTDRGSMR